MHIATNPISSVVRGTEKSTKPTSKIDELEDNQLELSRRIVENEEN